MCPVRLNKPSDLITDSRLDQNPPDPARARGKLTVLTGTFLNLIDDDLNSTFVMCQIPGDCILGAGTTFVVTNCGYAQIRIGTRQNSNVLVNQTKLTGNVVVPIVIGDAKHGLPAWQQLGMAANNADNLIDLIFTAGANAVAPGSIAFEVHYRKH